MTKLIDLNPAWEVEYPNRPGIGVVFDCPGPCCDGKPSPGKHDPEEGKPKKERLHVPFANPTDGQPASPGRTLWQRTGDTFDSLTLTPSVDASAFGHWHGFVTNGECR